MNQRDDTESLVRFSDAEVSSVDAEGEPVGEDTEGYGRSYRLPEDVPITAEREDSEGYGRSWRRPEGEPSGTEGDDTEVHGLKAR